MKKDNFITIYDDDIYQYIDDHREVILKYLQDNEVDAMPDDIEAAASMFIDDDYLDLRDVIKAYDAKHNYNKIVVCGCLGLWYGKRQVKASFNDLFTAFYRCTQDVNKVYFKNKNTTLQLDACHHDGCNSFKFYKVVNGKQRAINYNDLFNL